MQTPRERKQENRAGEWEGKGGRKKENPSHSDSKFLLPCGNKTVPDWAIRKPRVL